MTKKIGFQTDMDGAVAQWLDNHHVRAKDVYAWSAAGQIDEVTTMTISFYVSDVVMAGPDAVDMADVRDDRPATTEDIPDTSAMTVTESTGRPWASEAVNKARWGDEPDTPDMAMPTRPDIPENWSWTPPASDMTADTAVIPVTSDPASAVTEQWARTGLTFDAPRPGLFDEPRPYVRPRPIKDNPQA